MRRRFRECARLMITRTVRALAWMWNYNRTRLKSQKTQFQTIFCHQTPKRTKFSGGFGAGLLFLRVGGWGAGATTGETDLDPKLPLLRLLSQTLYKKIINFFFSSVMFGYLHGRDYLLVWRALYRQRTRSERDQSLERPASIPAFVPRPMCFQIPRIDSLFLWI